MVKTLHFANKKKYEKWLAYGHIHKVFHPYGKGQRIMLHGKRHKVRH